MTGPSQILLVWLGATREQTRGPCYGGEHFLSHMTRVNHLDALCRCQTVSWTCLMSAQLVVSTLTNVKFDDEAALRQKKV